MTRPIYEPSEARDIAQLGFGQRQLFRRPAPVASGGHTHPWAILVKETDEAFSNGNSNTIFEEDDGGSHSDPDIIEAGQDGSDVWQILFKRTGIYQVYCGVHWTTDFTGEIQLHFRADAANFFIVGESATDGPHVAIYKDTLEGRGLDTRFTSVSGVYICTTVQGDDPADIPASKITPIISNFSGASRTMANAFAVAYLVVEIESEPS